MDQTEKRLMELKEEIQKVKDEKNISQGKLQASMERLKTEFKVESLDEAIALRETLQTEIEERNLKITKDLREVEKELKL